jgi:hypothetical protein
VADVYCSNPECPEYGVAKDNPGDYLPSAVRCGDCGQACTDVAPPPEGRAQDTGEAAGEAAGEGDAGEGKAAKSRTARKRSGS